MHEIAKKHVLAVQEAIESHDMGKVMEAAGLAIETLGGDTNVIVHFSAPILLNYVILLALSRDFKKE